MKMKMKQNLLLMYSTVIELLLFLTIPFFVEIVTPKRTNVASCLMVLFAIYTLEIVGAGLSLLYLEL